MNKKQEIFNLKQQFLYLAILGITNARTSNTMVYIYSSITVQVSQSYKCSNGTFSRKCEDDFIATRS